MDETLFRSRIMPLNKRLFAYALSIVGDESDAADCMQEALTKLWEHRSRLDRLENVEAYATVTVRNVAVNFLTRNSRSSGRFVEDPPDVSDSSPIPSEELESREELLNVARMLKTLPDNQRRVMVMSAVSGLSNEEIRSATGFSDDNVRVLLSRARKKLRRLFNKG